MPQYYFQLRTPDAATPLDAAPRELPSLAAALAEARGTARTLLRGARRAPLGASLDVEDARRLPVARILLADIARQIS